ncbi:MAG TPA: response regulator transcription factor [Pyrinomonadaceae bacterium]|jgi:DNA-binding NarL/FixJ family response regulator|nr:response regulator transcription factor [Pyrinomonadaceae bacterium]
MAKQLLVVDDDPSLLLAVSETLRAEGYEVQTARRGSEAMIRVAESLPDLIISDIRMPGMDGYALVRNLRAAPRTRLVPIVFLTAKDETTDRIAGFRTGVDAYVTKPFEPEELVAIVKSILDRVQRTHSDLARMFGGQEEAAEAELVRDEELTDAEWRVAEAVARGLSNKEIAAELKLSLRTIEGHISRILDKKNLSNRVELALHVRERRSSD